jgi:hypothetical protein
VFIQKAEEKGSNNIPATGRFMGTIALRKENILARTKTTPKKGGF